MLTGQGYSANFLAIMVGFRCEITKKHVSIHTTLSCKHCATLCKRQVYNLLNKKKQAYFRGKSSYFRRKLSIDTGIRTVSNGGINLSVYKL